MKKLCICTLLSLLPCFGIAQRGSGLGRGSDYGSSSGDIYSSLYFIIFFVTVVFLLWGFFVIKDKLKGKHLSDILVAVFLGAIGLLLLAGVITFLSGDTATGNSLATIIVVVGIIGFIVLKFLK